MRLARFVVLLLLAGFILTQHANRAGAQGDAKHIKLHLANDVVALETKATTVGTFLDELSLALPPSTIPNPPPGAALQDGMSIFLPDISVTRGETEQPIPPLITIEESWHYGPEQVQLKDPGQAGMVRTTCTIFYYGAQEVGRRQREDIVRQMRPQRVVCFRELTSADGPSKEDILSKRVKPSEDISPPLRYKRIVSMESTAYEPGPTSCGNDSGATATGLQAGYGVVAVDPHVIELGTRLFIEGYGYAVAGDTGGAIKGDKIDLGFMTLDECYAWGRRTVNVYVLY